MSQFHLIDGEREEFSDWALPVLTVEVLEILNLRDAHSPVTIGVEHIEDGSGLVGRIDVLARQTRGIPIQFEQVAESLGPLSRMRANIRRRPSSAPGVGNRLTLQFGPIILGSVAGVSRSTSQTK